MLFPGGAGRPPAPFRRGDPPDRDRGRAARRPRAAAGAVGHRARGHYPRDLPRAAGAERGARRLADSGSSERRHRASSERRRRPRRAGPPIDVQPDSRLAAIFGETSFGVNSFHHQASSARARAQGGRLVRRRRRSRRVESTEHPWLLAVQFHPENLVASPRAEPQAVRRRSWRPAPSARGSTSRSLTDPAEPSRRIPILSESGVTGVRSDRLLHRERERAGPRCGEVRSLTSLSQKVRREVREEASGGEGAGERGAGARLGPARRAGGGVSCRGEAGLWTIRPLERRAAGWRPARGGRGSGG